MIIILIIIETNLSLILAQCCHYFTQWIIIIVNLNLNQTGPVNCIESAVWLLAWYIVKTNCNVFTVFFFFFYHLHPKNSHMTTLFMQATQSVTFKTWCSFLIWVHCMYDNLWNSLRTAEEYVERKMCLIWQQIKE